MKPIVVVGSINMDLVCRTERIPAPGETIFGSDFQMHTGGKGANQAVAVAKLGYPSILLGKVGTDLFGSQLRETLSGYGVDMSTVETAEGPSGTASIVVDDQGENSIIVIPGANLHVTPAYLETKMEVLRQAGMVLAQLEVPLATVTRLAEICTELQIPLMLDPAPAQKLDAKILSRVSWFTPNQTEAEFYAGAEASSEETLQKLFGAGVRNVILKRGSDGCIVATAEGERHHLESFRVNAVDTTAAGDAFNGAFSVALLSGMKPIEAARYASAAAAISVTRKGAQPSLATADEVKSLLAQIHQAHAV